MTLEDIVKKSSGGIYNNAAQIWNHTFFWNCMKPGGGGEPDAARWPRRSTPSGAATPPSRKRSSSRAVGNFGSGWTWLVKKADGCVDIVNTGAAGTPLTTADKAAADDRRLGARLLHRLPQPAPEVRRDLPRQARELGLRGEELRLSRAAAHAAKSRPAGRLFRVRAQRCRERRAAELAARLDAALGEPALVHLEHVAHRLGRAVASRASAASCRSMLTMRAVVGDEGDRQRQQRVLHPEALLRRLLEDEQHAFVAAASRVRNIRPISRCSGVRATSARMLCMPAVSVIAAASAAPGLGGRAAGQRGASSDSAARQARRVHRGYFLAPSMRRRRQRSTAGPGTADGLPERRPCGSCAAWAASRPLTGRR